MKKTVIVCLAALLLVGCQESMDERCAREAREYTEKNCPAPVAEGVTVDSLVYDQRTRTLRYNYSVDGRIDNGELFRKDEMRDVLLKELKNSTSLKAYKEAGYNFRYVYRSTRDKGTKLFEATFSEKDYK